MHVCLPQEFKIVEAWYPYITDGSARTSLYVNVENCTRAWFIGQVYGGAATACTFTLYEAAAATGGTISTASFRWWLNNATAQTTDTLTAQTAGASFATAATAANHMVVIEIDPALLTSGYPFVCIKTAGASASNYISGVFLLETSYPQATPPTVGA